MSHIRWDALATVSLLALTLNVHLSAQATPIATPALFAEGVISTGDDEFGGSFTPDGDTVYFSRSAPHSYRYTMLRSYRDHGQWTTPTVLPFSGRYTDSDPTLSPDGRKLFWTSDRPVDSGQVKHDYDIWMVERTASGAWGSPQHLPPPINSNDNEYAESMTKDGVLYFSSSRNGGIHAFRSAFVNGAWSTPEDVTVEIDQGDTSVVAWDLDVMIDPDERFVMLGSIRREGFGHFDLYISWRDHDHWGPLVHLPAPFNTPARDYAPHLSPDGKTLYFASERGFGLQAQDRALTYRELTDSLRGTRNGSGNIYSIPFDAVAALRLPVTSGTSCPAAAAAAFSWWPGTWDYATPGFDPGVSAVEGSDGGCTLKEEFVDIHGQKAHTTIHYDAGTNRWERVVTDPFRTYHSNGTFAADGGIAFYETPTDRESYRRSDPNHVHFTGEKSDDGGRTWHLLFDATYTRKR